MKRHALTVVLILAIALLSVVGSAQAEKVKLTMWSWNHEPTYYLDLLLIEEYMKLNPNVEITRIAIPNQDYATKLLMGLATGKGPTSLELR